jgi:ribosomal protein L19
MINLIQQLRIEANNIKINKQDAINSGDVLSITTTQYKNKKRKQTIKGICIGIKKRTGITTIRLRNVIANEGVEQTFILSSPIINQIDKIDTLKTGTRAKKYYLRKRAPSENKI